MQEVGKTSNFLKAINKYAAEQRKEIKTRADEFRKYELQKAEVEVLRDAYYLIQNEMAQMKKSISSEVSRLEVEKRKELFAKRNAIMDEVLGKAREKLVAFTKTQEYVELLKRSAASISEVLKKSGTTLYISKNDEHLVEAIREAYGKICKVEVSKDKNGYMHLEVNAYNSYGVSVHIVYDGTPIGAGVENVATPSAS